MEPVRWGVIGTAKIALEKVIPAMAGATDANVVAIASRSAEAAAQAAEKLGIPRAYGSYEALLADPEIEAVYIPLPNHLHVPWSIKAAEAGKHVLCEKPIALNAAEARSLISARDQAGVLMAEAFMVRCHPQWLRARDIVRSGRIGEPRTIQTLFSYYNVDPDNIRNKADLGGGALYDIGCYAVVTARFLFGTEPTRVAALIDRDPNMGTDRLSSGLVDFGHGRHLTFTCSTQLMPYQRVQIVGTKGRVEIEIPFNAPPDKPTRIFIDDGTESSEGGMVTETFAATDQYAVQADLFSRAVRGIAPLDHPLEDAVANMRVIDALYRAGDGGDWVSL